MQDFTLRMNEIFKSLGYEEKKEKKPLYQELDEIMERVKNIRPMENKNIFARGDFDEYKINDEELAEHQFIQKSNILPIGHITEHPDGSLSQKVAQGKWIYLSYNIKDLSDKQTGDDEFDKQRGREILERMNLAMQATPIKNINPIFVPNGNETYLANFLKPYLDKIENEIKSGNLRCKANGKSVVQFLRTHTYKNKKGVRSGDDLQNHAGYLPFVIPLIKKYGITDTSMNRPAKNNATFIELIGRADIINPVTNKKERVGISVVLVTLGNKTSMLKDISVFKIFDKYSLIKSIQHNSLDVSIASLDMGRIDLLNHQTIKIISPFENKSSNKLKKVQKSLTYSGHKLQGRTKLYGMNISIENKKGTYRSGVDSDGHKWKCFMNYDYGYIRGTEGVDGDHVDCYIGPNNEAQKVYVIHQNNPVTHKYDEDKCMLCFENADKAKKAYLKQYDRPGFFGSMETMEIEKFKEYVFNHLGKKIVKKSFNLQLKDVTPENAIEKFNKAYGVIAYQLGIHKSQTGKSLDGKGEGFYYDSQKELTEQYFKYFDTLTKELYEAVCNYCGLPLSNVVTKAVTYKGKILYNPESGKPLSQVDIDNLVNLTTKYLNRNRKIGAEIVTRSQVLGKVLEKLYQNNTPEGIRKIQLSKLKYNNVLFNTIIENEKKIADMLGLSRDEFNKIELIKQSAAQHITNVNDKIKNDVQTILIDGIKANKSKSQVSQDLFNKLGAENRDWKKIADTEIQNNLNNSYIRETIKKNGPEKTYFMRMEVLDGRTCDFCRKMNGKIVLFSNVPLDNDNIKDKYATKAIWEGKDWDGTNNKVTSGIFHPQCRGVWVEYEPE